MSERREYAAAASTRDADASPILIWNGFVTRMRRVGVERRGRKLARTQTIHSSENEKAPPSAERAAEPLYEAVDERFSSDGSL